VSPSSLYVKNGNTFSVASHGSLDVREVLPAQTYVLKLDPNHGFYMETVENFSLPPKVYGDTTRLADRVIHTFLSRPRSTGVLLVGDKGSGKTLLARAISLECISRSIPTLIINTPFKGDSFNSFIQSITQPCVIIFDEFEKVYNNKDQEHILTLLDGVFQSQKLFILTSNEKHRIDDNMKNRPGRIFYLFNFKGLDESFVREYCEDNLKDKSKIDDIIRVSSLFDSFNFDLLCAFVEEVNRYNEDPRDLIELLNARPEYCGGMGYEIGSVLFRDIQVPLKSVDCNDLGAFNTTNDSFYTYIYFAYRKDDEELEKMFKSMDENDDENDMDTYYDLYKQGKVKFKSEVVKSSRNILASRAALAEKNTGIRMVNIVMVPGDIMEYRPNGAVYKDEASGVIVYIKRGSEEKKSISSMMKGCNHTLNFDSQPDIDLPLLLGEVRGQD
jgi:hypothetical protein